MANDVNDFLRTGVPHKSHLAPDDNVRGGDGLVGVLVLVVIFSVFAGIVYRITQKRLRGLKNIKIEITRTD